MQELWSFADHFHSTQINWITKYVQESEPALNEAVVCQLTYAVFCEGGNRAPILRA